MGTSNGTYTPATDRYKRGRYRRCGHTGLLLPAISLGMWHNFGSGDPSVTDENCKDLCFTAFDHGITYFDLANNYGPPPGSAEIRMGRILKHMPRRELVISTKAGYHMWSGPYGEWGSRKYLLSSLDESLRRLDLDYVDIFYHHRPDPETPLEETLGALEQAVRSGKALYAAVSNYSARRVRRAAKMTEARHMPPVICNQVSYSLFNRKIEIELLETCAKYGVGIAAFCPLAQGLLTDKYLTGIPEDSRAASETGFLKPNHITRDSLLKVGKLNEIAKARGQSLAQMALSWVLRDDRVTTAIIGASRPKQIVENMAAVDKAAFTHDELQAIDQIMGVPKPEEQPVEESAKAEEKAEQNAEA